MTVFNHFIFIPPLKTVKMSAADATGFKALLDTLNERLVTISNAEIQQIETLMLIAGSEAKAPAIEYLLDNDMPFQVRWVCTDDVAAKRILQSAKRS